jgi:hypothetical protein
MKFFNGMRKIEIDGVTYSYTIGRNGVTLNMKGIKMDMSKYQAAQHLAGREKYDTPASIRGCSCVACNATRKLYGHKKITGYHPFIMNNYGLLPCGKTRSEIETEIENRIMEIN